MQRVRLSVSPAGDAEFATLAQRLAHEAPDRAEFERRLRDRYPAAVVRSRDLSGEPASSFYVYRDGHWSSDKDGNRA
jgi:hypothetical protein